MIEGSGTRGEAGPDTLQGHRGGLWVRSHLSVVEAIAAVPLAGVLFLLYHHLAATVPLNSDLAVLALQAQDVLHGDPTVSGWVTPQDNALLTELPLYTVTVALHGLSPTVVNVASAIVYTATMLVIVALARTGLPRRDQVLAMVVAFGLVAAPSPHGASVVVPGHHTGTALFALAAILCLHAGHRRARIALTLLALLLLTLAVASDPLALYTGALPIALVHGLRLASRLPRGVLDEGPDFAVGVAGAGLGWLAGKVLPAALGYHLLPLASAFAALSAIPGDIQVTLQSWLPLFGAQFFGQGLTRTSVWELFRLLGYVFTVAACVAVCVQSVRAARRGAGQPAGGPLVLSQLLLAVVVCDIAAVIFSTNSSGGDDGRYLIPAVLAGAALAGRAAPSMLVRPRWRAVAAAISVCYIALLPLSLLRPPAPLPESGLTTWLEARGLDHGLAEYWGANVVTVESGGTVQIRAVSNVNGKLGPYYWNTNTRWYSGRGYANFVVIDGRTNYHITSAVATATFGAPAYERQVDGVTVMVWNHNLLPELGPGWPPLKG